MPLTKLLFKNQKKKKRERKQQKQQQKKPLYFLWKMPMLHYKASGTELKPCFFIETWDCQVYGVLVMFGIEV